MRTRVRLARADALLSETSTKLSAVGVEIGFGSTAHFIAWFRRHRGVTPGAWRARTIPGVDG